MQVATGGCSLPGLTQRTTVGRLPRGIGCEGSDAQDVGGEAGGRVSSRFRTRGRCLFAEFPVCCLGRPFFWSFLHAFGSCKKNIII